MADERFPIQEGPSVPWAFMAPHESQCQKNHGQSLKRIAERGGLGASEAWAVVNGIRYYEIKDEHAQKWFELAERVNREWSVKQARAEVLAACIEALKDGVPIGAGHGVGYIYNVLSNVQPAASDLEALRSRAYRDGATGAAVWFVKLLHGHPEDPPEMGCKPEAISEKLEALLREEQKRYGLLQAHTYELLGDLHTGEKGEIADSMQRVEADLKKIEKARASEGKG